MNEKCLSKIRDLSEHDIPQLRHIHRDAFKGTLGIMLGDNYIDAFLRWFIRNPSSICLGYETEGKIVGYVLGAPSGYGTQHNRDLLGVIVAAIISHFWVILHPTFVRKIAPRIRSVVGKLDGGRTDSEKMPEATWFSLVAVGVSANNRRQGVATLIVDAFVREVWNRHFREVRLTAHKRNVNAIRFYEANDWKLVEENAYVKTYARRY